MNQNPQPGQVMFPIYFNPFSNQISYSMQNPNQARYTFVPIVSNNLPNQIIHNPVPHSAMGSLTLNAQKLNQDLHNQNLRNIKIKESHFLSQTQRQPVPNPRFVIIKNTKSLENAKRSKNLSLNGEDSSFQTTNHATNPKPDDTSGNSDSPSMNLNVQINVEFDHDGRNIAQNAFKKIIKEKLNAIQRSMNQIKSVKLLFTESATSTPKVNSETKMERLACNSISLISTSEAFDSEARTTIEESLWNVLKNSRLHASTQQTHKDTLLQTAQVVFQILNSINFSNSISFEKNFFRLFNLQVPVDAKLFSSLTVGCQLKIVCYLFCKYFKKDFVSLLFEDFYSDVSISEICADNRSKAKRTSEDFFLDVSESHEPAPPASVREAAEPQVETPLKLSTIFTDCEDSPFDWRLVRKLVILLLHQLRLFKDYLTVKTNSQESFLNPPETIRKLRLCISTQSLCDEQFAVDRECLGLTLPELLARVSIRDLQLFVAVSNADFEPKRTSKTVYFVDAHNCKRQLDMTLFERDSLLLPKTKRKDEKIKFVFKSIRKQLFNDFKLQSKNNHSVSEAKRLFNQKYLNGDEEAIRYFYSNDLSKKKLKVLADCKRLIHNMKQYQHQRYVKDQVEISIYRKSEDFLANRRLSLDDFKKLLFDRQSKHTWILQDVLNSIPAFEAFFVFSRLKKRIKKKKMKRRKLA